jgi:putative membrane protein
MARRSLRDPARLADEGEDPDYRFTLANERTFLAWMRTSLALMAAGVAVIRFVPGQSVVRHALGFLLIGLGGVVSLVSYRHWWDNEHAMRTGGALHVSPVPRIVSWVLVLAAVAAMVLVVVDEVS